MPLAEDFTAGFVVHPNAPNQGKLHSASGPPVFTSDREAATHGGVRFQWQESTMSESGCVEFEVPVRVPLGRFGRVTPLGRRSDGGNDDSDGKRIAMPVEVATPLSDRPHARRAGKTPNPNPAGAACRTPRPVELGIDALSARLLSARSQDAQPSCASTRPIEPSRLASAPLTAAVECKQRCHGPPAAGSADRAQLSPRASSAQSRAAEVRTLAASDSMPPRAASVSETLLDMPLLLALDRAKAQRSCTETPRCSSAPSSAFGPHHSTAAAESSRSFGASSPDARGTSETTASAGHSSAADCYPAPAAPPSHTPRVNRPCAQPSSQSMLKPVAPLAEPSHPCRTLQSPRVGTMVRHGAMKLLQAPNDGAACEVATACEVAPACDVAARMTCAVPCSTDLMGPIEAMLFSRGLRRKGDLCCSFGPQQGRGLVPDSERSQAGRPDGQIAPYHIVGNIVGSRSRRGPSEFFDFSIGARH
jgi:hypothetical protein